MACYDFPTFISNEIEINLFKIGKIDFRHYSFLWWLIIHQNLQFLVNGGLYKVVVTTAITPSSNDIKALVLTKVNNSYYEFIKKFYVSTMKMVTGYEVAKLYQTVRNELQGGNKI